MRYPVLLTVFSLALIAGGCAHKQVDPALKNEGESTFYGTSHVHRYRLTNGLKILVLEDHSAPVFSYQTWFHVGSRDEQPGLTGLAHLFEHMMFKQTKTLKDGEFDRILESAGVEGENAFTNRDYTGYIQSLPISKLELIASLEASRMTDLVVNDAQLNSEREVVQNERRFREENSPDGQLYEKLHELAYKKHPYHWPVIGYENDLKNAKRPEVESFYKRFYAPNNATVVIVGDVDPDKAASVVEKFYSKLASSKIDRRQPVQEPKQTSERTLIKEIKTPVEKIFLGYHTVDITSLDYPALEVLRNVLVGGKGSRLYRALVDAGIASGVDIQNDENIDPGMFILFVNMQKGKTAKQAMAVIDREIQRLKSSGVTATELQRSIALHRFTVFDGLTTTFSKAHFLGFYETVGGDFNRGKAIIDALSKVDSSEVVRVARTYLKKENRTVVTGVPQ